MSQYPPEFHALRATIARLSRLHGANDERTVEAKRAYYLAQIEHQVEKAVAAAPPFTPAQLAKIGAILDAAPVVHDRAEAVAS